MGGTLIPHFVLTAAQTLPPNDVTGSGHNSDVIASFSPMGGNGIASSMHKTDV